MKTDKRKRGSFFTLLVRYYIGFTFALVILSVFIFKTTFLMGMGVLKVPMIERLISYRDLLTQEEYDELPVEKLLGPSGFIEVLDERNEPIYQSSEGPRHYYTRGELECIPDFENEIVVDTTECPTSDNKKQTLITLKSINTEGDYTAQGFIVLDENLNILASTSKTKRTRFTPEEFGYLTKKLPAKYDLQKYIFTTESGKARTLIIQSQKITEEEVDQIFDKAFNFTFYIFLVFYVLMIVIFIAWLNHKVKKPLSILNTAMLDFAEGKGVGEIYYSGPREFVQICDNFNKMATRLAASEKERQKLEEDKQKMLADISHDLKTPITVIQGYSKAICDGLIKDDKKEQYLTTIYQKSNTLTELINTFYEYSKLEHPDFKLVLEKDDICEYAREYLVSKYNEIDLMRFELEVDIPESKIECNIDKLQLKRAFENIITNTLKHNPVGTTLFFAMSEKESEVKITIADNGIGIPSNIAGSIFEPFVVGDDSRNNKQGSGLGLVIGQKIVRAHGGEISFINPPNKGYQTQFEIILPKIKKEREIFK